MSGRFQTHTVASEGVELDDNYQKMVADIEEQTQRSGWLFGRGAFDKGDLQYLRDFNNSLRYKEVEIEDKEKELWERERAWVEAEAEAAAAAAAAQQAAALTRRSSGGSVPGAFPGLRGPPGLSSRPAPLLLPVKVKPAGSKHHHTPQSASSPAGGGLPSCKRARTDPAVSGGNAPSSPPSTTTGLATAPTATLPLRSTKSEPSPGDASNSHSAGATDPGGVRPVATPHADRGGTYEAREQQVTSTRTQLAQDVSCPGADQGGPSGSQATSSERGTGRDGAVFGLATLLGGYGSEDEDEEEEGADGRYSRGGADGDGPGGSSIGGRGDRGVGKGSADGGAKVENEGAELQCGSGGLEGSRGKVGAAVGGAVSKLPPPVGLLSPEELLGDPRVLSEGLVATRPKQQDVQGGDAWDSEEMQSSDSDA